jgi:hypothetical protein
MGSMLKLLIMLKTLGGNISTMTLTLTSIISSKVLGLTTPFVGSCWGHAMFKSYQHAIDDFKVCTSLTSISIKET